MKDIKNLDKYEVIVFAGHGEYYSSIADPIWLLNEVRSSTKDKDYTIDIKQNRVIGFSCDELGKTYAVLPSLIRASYSATAFSNSFIFSESCQFMGKDDNIVESFADAFLSRSAKAVVGFHNSVNSAYARQFMWCYISELIDGKTAQNAFDTVKKQNGANDGGNPGGFLGWGSKPAAYPLFRGTSSATLYHTELKNCSFETFSFFDSKKPLEWKSFADVRVISKLGELTPTHGVMMAMLSTGIGAAKDDYISSFSGATQGSVMQQPFKPSSSAKTLTFNYNMVSEEPPEFVGSQYDDTFIAQILDAGGNVLEEIVYESVNTSDWLPVLGFKLTQGQDNGRPAWQTGWKTITIDMTPYRNQFVTLRFLVFDRGDAIYDSAALIDNVVLK